jgi:carbonic anhydrase
MQPWQRLLFALLLLPSLLPAQHEHNYAKNPEASAHWEYRGKSGPVHWKDLCPAYSNCGGIHQSPVDINSPVIDPNLHGLELHYQPHTIMAHNNGHTVQFGYQNGSYLIFNDTRFELVQFHFHTSSEHLVEGHAYPLEIHLVHRDTASGHLAVIGVFLEEGHQNALLHQLLPMMPQEKNTEKSSQQLFNAENLLPADEGYYTYEGSLTTPPCTEDVTWVVMKHTIKAAPEQLKFLHKILRQDNRPVQPLHGRVIRSCNEPIHH